MDISPQRSSIRAMSNFSPEDAFKHAGTCSCHVDMGRMRPPTGAIPSPYCISKQISSANEHGDFSSPCPHGLPPFNGPDAIDLSLVLSDPWVQLDHWVHCVSLQSTQFCVSRSITQGRSSVTRGRHSLPPFSLGRAIVMKRCRTFSSPAQPPQPPHSDSSQSTQFCTSGGGHCFPPFVAF